MADIDSPGPVADALSDLYRSLHQAVEIGVRQKVRFKIRFHYAGLVRLYHHLLMGEHAHDPGRDEHGHGHGHDHAPGSLGHLLLCILARIEHMHADADSTLDPVTPTDDVKPALEAMVAALEAAYAAADAAADAAESAKDRPAFGLAADTLKALDCHVGRFRAELAKISDMGSLYMVLAAN